MSDSVTGDLSHLVMVGTGAPAAPSPADANRAAAAARLEFLKNDSEFVKLHLSGNEGTKAELAKLAEIIASPREGTTHHGGVTNEQQLAEQAATAGMMADVGEDVLGHIKTGAAVSAQEYRLAVARKDLLFGDSAWRDKFFRGDAQAKKEKLLLDVILASPIKTGA
jgi:hypothetical protein